MRFTPGVLNCSDHYPTTNRVSRFRYIQVEVLPATNLQDENLLKGMLAQAETLASQVTKNSANDASFVRSQERLIRNALAGLLSESAWRLAVNGLTKKETLSSTNFTHTYEQIDLVTDDNKTIEVRSSFPRKGLAFALCNPTYEFDVIGPYVNDYKPGEISKDIYVRTLFPFEESELLERIRGKGIQMFLTGGATHEMFSNSALFIEKSMTSMEDVLLNQVGPASKYRVIPFSKALDTFEIAEILGYQHREAWSSFENT
jgi:hypothetical protein